MDATEDTSKPLFAAQAVENGLGADKWAVYARSSWFQQNWRQTLDNHKAIVVMMGCYTADGGAQAVVANTGGRVSFGYTGMVPIDVQHGDVHQKDMQKLFGRLNGNLGRAAGGGLPYAAAGSLRTVGEAYGGGQEYITYKINEAPASGVRCQLVPYHPQNNNVWKWTTLNPSPMTLYVGTDASPELYPEYADPKEGAGCIVFDTYMDHSRTADNAVEAGPPISSRRWFLSPGETNAYLLSFDYDKVDDASLVARGGGENCVNKQENSQTGQRHMSGDRKEYGSDRQWPPGKGSN